MAENFILSGTTNENNRMEATERDFASTVAKHYIEQRKEKAAKQAEDEKNGVSNTKLSDQRWDEMRSYRYAIL